MSISCSMKLKKKSFFFAWIVKLCLKASLTQRKMRNLEFLITILRSSNFKKVKFMHFFLNFKKKMLKIKQKYCLWIAIFQNWVDEFKISEILWVRGALGHIIIGSTIFVSQKFPNLAPLFFQFHIQNLHLQLLHRTIDNAQNDETAQIWNKTGYELT